MKVMHLAAAETYEPEQDWRRASLCNESSISVEHFVKPPHHASRLHQHPSQQVCIVIQGRMAVRTADGREEVLEAGDAAFLAAEEPHQVVNLLDVPSIGIDIFCPGRSFDFWLSRHTALT